METIIDALAGETPSPEPSATPIASGDISLGDTLQQIDSSLFEYGFFYTLVFAVIAAGIAFFVIWLLQHFLRDKLQGNMKIFYRLIHVVVIVLAVFAVLMTIKPLKSLSTVILASSGIAAVVIGLAAQQTLGNLFSGISISTSKPFNIGEFIEILDVNPPISGVVEEIGLRHTTIRDASNKTIVIPNSVLDKEILRTTHYLEGTNVCNFLFVNVAYSSDLAAAIQTLSSVCAGHKSVLDTRTHEQKENGGPAVAVHVMDFLESSIQLRASVWTKDAATGFEALSDLRYEVKNAFGEKGVEIPCPYRNVVMKDSSG